MNQELIDKIAELDGVISVEPIYSDPQESNEILLNIVYEDK